MVFVSFLCKCNLVFCDVEEGVNDMSMESIQEEVRYKL